MNSSVPNFVHSDHYYNGSLVFPGADDITHDLVCLVVAFLLASATASLLTSRSALRYGIFCASLSIWRLSIALASITTFSTLALAASSLFYILRATITPERAYTHNTINQKSANTVHYDTRRDSLDENLEYEDVPTHLHYFKPLFFPSRTTHRRLHPTPHAFNYSYLLVGLPVLRRPINDNPMLASHPIPLCQHNRRSSHSQSPTQTAWFSVHASDYLQRGPAYHDLTLRAKLDIYLKSQGILNPEETFPYAYLVTAPRFLGFSFNPVSFWYLYDVNQDLKAMILEVNNTFDERRMYLLRGDDGEVQGTNDGGTAYSKDNPIKSTTTRFTNKWKKDFHVSPFNDREGTYSVSATDILRTGQLDVTIVLSDNSDKATTSIDPSASIKTAPKPSLTSPPASASAQTSEPETPHSRAKIIARVYTPTSSTPTNPTILSLPQRLRFTITHGPTGFLTNPRILIEARKLWTMGLTVFYRPEPFESTIPRVESHEETVVEGRFRDVVAGLVGKTGVEMGVLYTSAAGLNRGVDVEIGVPKDQGRQNDNQQRKQTQIHGHAGRTTIDEEAGTKGPVSPRLKIHVLTPTFYTELAKTNDDLQGVFDRFGFNAQHDEKLVHCSSAELLRVVLGGELVSRADEVKSVPTHAVDGNGNGNGDGARGLFPKFKLKLEASIPVLLEWTIYRLRLATQEGLSSLFSLRRDLPPSPSPSTSTSASTSPTRSPFDSQVHAISTPSQYTSYLRAVLTILLADRFALGSTALLKFQIRVFRFMTVMMVVNVGIGVTRYVLHGGVHS